MYVMVQGHTSEGTPHVTILKVYTSVLASHNAEKTQAQYVTPSVIAN